jgi:hypothetical protein
MKDFVGATDNDWRTFLSQQPGIDDVDFWQPGPAPNFSPGTTKTFSGNGVA